MTWTGCDEDYDDLAEALEAACQDALRHRKRIVQAHLGELGKNCCPFGALVAGQTLPDSTFVFGYGHPTPGTFAFLGIPNGAVIDFMNAFDSEEAVCLHDQHAFELGVKFRKKYVERSAP